jgi:hypothetical protein
MFSVTLSSELHVLLSLIINLQCDESVHVITLNLDVRYLTSQACCSDHQASPALSLAYYYMLGPRLTSYDIVVLPYAGLPRHPVIRACRADRRSEVS